MSHETGAPEAGPSGPASDGGSSYWKFVVGVAVGVLLTSAYIKSAFELPAFLRAGEEITATAVKVTATETLYDPDASRKQRRRALAVYLAHEHKTFLEIDEQLNDAVLEAVLHRKALVSAEQLRLSFGGYDQMLAQPRLRERAVQRHGRGTDEELKHRILLQDLREDEFLWWYLSRRYPDATPSQRADLILNLPEHRLRAPDAATRAR
jgi:hypothetical protein